MEFPPILIRERQHYENNNLKILYRKYIGFINFPNGLHRTCRSIDLQAGRNDLITPPVVPIFFHPRHVRVSERPKPIKEKVS